MKRKLLLMGIFILFSSATVFAQIENEIEQSKSEQIRKGREYLLEKFLDRDFDKVKEIKDYLLELETEHYKAFSLVELWHILFWTQEFDALTASFRQVDSAFINDWSLSIIPYYDRLGEHLYRRNEEDELLLRFNLKEAKLPVEDEAFLNLYLDWDNRSRNYSPKNKEYMEKCNEKADLFLAQYPNSEYEWFVRHFIREVYVDNKWGFGIGVDLCSGFATGTFARPQIGTGISLDVFHKKLDFMLEAQALLGKTAIDVPYSIESVPQIYEKGNEAHLAVWYANVSYTVWEKKPWRLAPFIGIGGVAETYPDDKISGSDLNKIETYHWTGNAGLCLDCFVHFMGDDGVFRIKYQFGTTLPNGQISTMHLFSIGWTAIARGKHRAF